MAAVPVKNRIGLALGGGATCGLAHSGVLKALEDHHIRPDCISGSSIGAFAATLYAFGVPIKEMRRVGQGMTPLNVSKLNLSRYAMFSNEELGKLILAEIGKARSEDAKIPLAIMATDIGSGEKIVLRRGEVAPAVMASSATPGIYMPVRIDGRMLMDGGIVEDVPISPLHVMDAENIIAVNLSAERNT
jgi:NTE family protein